MKRILVLLLSLCLLVGCAQQPAPAPEAPQEPQPSQFVFTRENFPRLNGSTSTVPLGQAIASVLLGERREDVADLTQFSKTTQSYRELMSRQADLLIAAEPAQIIWEEKESQNFDWQMVPFAVDGLVFIVNADNPVDSLTIQQVQKIYTGEITNWSEVGGEDLEIVPFQRNPEAGSQTAMLKLVMGDLPMMDAPAEYVRGEMGDLIEAVASYDNTAAAIGYTVYYYANDMKMAEGLKILTIEGVEPKAETIRSGEYPFLNNYYVLTAANLSEDAPAQVLYDWILSEEGQSLVAHEGYVSVLDVEDTWSKLEPYEPIQPVYTYFVPYSGSDPLLARSDYGALLPYLGADIRVDNYIIDRLPMFGLVTADGQLVTEPVYADIYRIGDFLLLAQGEVYARHEEEWGGTWVEGSFVYTIAASDGSWVYSAVSCDSPFLLADGRLALPLKDGGAQVLNSDGSLAATFTRSDFAPFLGESYEWSWGGSPYLTEYNGHLVVWGFDLENYCDIILCYLDVDNGEVSSTPPSGFEDYEYISEPWPEFEGYFSAEPITDTFDGTTYYLARRHENNTAICDLLNERGEVVFPDCDVESGLIWSPIIHAGLISTIEDNCFCYRSIVDHSLVFRYPLQSNSD